MAKAIHNSAFSTLTVKDTAKQSQGYKPQGLWYGIDSAWLEWCESEMPQWVRPYNYVLEIDYSKMLVLTTEAELLEFTNRFLCKGGPKLFKSFEQQLVGFIDWPLVAQEYSGIEIPSYVWDCRFTLMWYYGWDCASGCIWRTDVVRSVTKIEINKTDQSLVVD